MHILVTGGAGYIGSHTVVELLAAGHEVVVVDNFVNSTREAIKRVEAISGRSIKVYEADLCDAEAVGKLFDENIFDAVIHFAGLKAVGESVSQPLRYYQNNLVSTLVLCRTMTTHNVRKLVFSSSATVYGLTEVVPTPETEPLGATNPYGRTKVMIEEIVRDLAVSGDGWQISCLRYFNPIGAHPSGNIGEDPNGTPNNLVPYIAQVAVGKHEQVTIYGDDYDTLDGTGVRDYIHVVDLARGHLAALDHLPPPGKCEAYNLGTGQGTSVLQMIKAFEAACGKTIEYTTADRRPGDIAVSLADPSKAQRELHWKAERSIEQACADAWRWQSQNPDGYRA